MSWTDERVEKLKSLWSEGLSASQIAAALGNVTRNAVIGKVHRLGLSGRTKSPSSASRPQKASPRRAPKDGGSVKQASAAAYTHGNAALSLSPEVERAPKTQPMVHPQFDPNVERTTILQLTEHTCRWPVGDPGSEEFYFCGQRPRVGAPYCEFHARIAYQPVNSRSARRSEAARA